MRKAAGIAFLALAAVSMAPAASASSELARDARSASARVNFTIRIPPVLRLRTLHAVPTVELPAADTGLAKALHVSDAATLEMKELGEKVFYGG